MATRSCSITLGVPTADTVVRPVRATLSVRGIRPGAPPRRPVRAAGAYTLGNVGLLVAFAIGLPSLDGFDDEDD